MFISKTHSKTNSSQRRTGQLRKYVNTQDYKYRLYNLFLLRGEICPKRDRTEI